jgi:predicted transposase YbfD/YdcC
MARSERHRQDHPDARNRHQDDDGDGLLSPEFAAVCRTFWTGGARALGVENKLHWILDVVMNEDQTRNRLDNGPHNLAILRHIALNIVTKEKSKISKRRKFNRAGWSNRFLAQLISQI